jgi:hypothetical protein
MNATHTPGPWTISERDPQRDQFYVFGTDFTGQDYPVATVTSCDDPDQHDANARLIAAAPELLDALKNLRAMVIGEHGASAYSNVNGERADAVIRKAEGAR